MTECPECGTAIPTGQAKFCLECGARLAPPASGDQTRKVVTVVFCDVVGSTALADRVDPEVHGAVMTRYFGEMRRVLEAHGGRVEKFIGDAVMAIFGVPVVHEDDALRAARAATEMQAAVGRLSVDLQQRYGVELAIRIGVNTGEVVVGEDERGTAAFGDAVNIAARLEQHAGPGDVLLGEHTFQLVRPAVAAEPVGPIVAKGKAAPLAAWRLLSVPEGTGRVESGLAAARVAFVGRERQLRALRDAFDGAVEDRTCHLVTVAGAAGNGKTRLVHEFVARLPGQALLLTGRCLSYGEGVAFWPLAEIVRAAAGIALADPPDSARERLASLLGGAADSAHLVDALAPVAGLSGRFARAEETQVAVRRLLEHLAQRAPVVVVIDDVHWAEPPLLDLVDNVVSLLRDAAVVVVCLARPEFLEARATWGAGAFNSTTIQLAPLSGDDVALMVGELLGDAPVDPDLVTAVAGAAGGNALFVEQLLAMMRDEGRVALVDGVWSMVGDLQRLELPPTISAVLRARLDQLPREERTVLEAGAVIGTEFYAGAIRDLTAAETDPLVLLTSLMRRDLVRTTVSDIDGEEAYRFVHVLVRETAYAAIPKMLRAQLHERFAAWLDSRSDRTTSDVDEFVGYHLEQACLLARELGSGDAHVARTGSAAAERLAKAARRTYLADPRGSAALFGRGAAVATTTAQRCALLHNRARGLYAAGDLVGSRDSHDEALALAVEAGDERLELTARLERAYVAEQVGEVHDMGELLEMAERVEREYADAGHPETLLAAEFARVHVANARTHFGECAVHARRAAELAAQIGDPVRGDVCQHFRAMALTEGPTPVDEALAVVRGIIDAADAPTATQAVFLGMEALLLARSDRADAARAALAAGAALLEGMDDTLWRNVYDGMATDAELTLGDLDAAERRSRAQVAWLEAHGETAWLSTYAPGHAIVFFDRVDDAEARRLLGLGRAYLVDDDVVTQSYVRALDGLLHSRAGQHAEAAELLREGVGWMSRGDQLVAQGMLYERYADVLVAGGAEAAAMAALVDALALYERKRDVADARRVRKRITMLQAAGVSSG